MKPKRAVTALAAVAIIILSACSGTAPNGAPSASASAAASTPTPTPTVAPTPTPTATPVPPPTMTADDEKIASLIKDTTVEVLDRMSIDFNTASDSKIANTFKGVRDYLDKQLIAIDVYTASECTQPAVDLFKEGATESRKGMQDFLDWLAGGATGSAPDSKLTVGDGATKLGSAVTSLAASC